MKLPRKVHWTDVRNKLAISGDPSRVSGFVVPEVRQPWKGFILDCQAEIVGSCDDQDLFGELIVEMAVRVEVEPEVDSEYGEAEAEEPLSEEEVEEEIEEEIEEEDGTGSGVAGLTGSFRRASLVEPETEVEPFVPRRSVSVSRTVPRREYRAVLPPVSQLVPQRYPVVVRPQDVNVMRKRIQVGHRRVELAEMELELEEMLGSLGGEH
jgi:hypothetical protein